MGTKHTGTAVRPIDDGRGRWRDPSRKRLPGESRVDFVRRTGVYECWRTRFEQWILVEGRSLSWIAAATGYSRCTISNIMQALEIYTREPYTITARSQYPEPLGDARPHHRKIETGWELPRTFEQWREQELRFQAMRLTHCSAWDRGW